MANIKLVIKLRYQKKTNFVERDACITDEYTVVRQRFIVDGIKGTPTIIEADKSESGDK